MLLFSLGIGEVNQCIGPGTDVYRMDFLLIVIFGRL